MSARANGTRIDLAAPWTGNVPIDSVIPNPDQPRKHFDEEKLAATARSCGVRQIQPVIVISHQDPVRPELRWMIVDGERRWRGLKAIGAKTIKVAYDPAIRHEHLFEASFAANFCREGHTRAETMTAVARMSDAGKTQAEIAEMVGKSVGWVNDFCAIRSLHPDLLKAMDFPPKNERKLPMNVARLIATLKPFDQIAQWDKVKHLPMAEAFHKVRTTGKVRHTCRRRADDADYAESKASNALRQAEAIVQLPLPMLKSLSRGNLDVILGIIDRIRSALATAEERLRAARKEAGEG